MLPRETPGCLGLGSDQQGLVAQGLVSRRSLLARRRAHARRAWNRSFPTACCNREVRTIGSKPGASRAPRRAIYSIEAVSERSAPPLRPRARRAVSRVLGFPRKGGRERTAACNSTGTPPQFHAPRCSSAGAAARAAALRLAPPLPSAHSPPSPCSLRCPAVQERPAGPRHHKEAPQPHSPATNAYTALRLRQPFTGALRLVCSTRGRLSAARAATLFRRLVTGRHQRHRSPAACSCAPQGHYGAPHPGQRSSCLRPAHRHPSGKQSIRASCPGLPARLRWHPATRPSLGAAVLPRGPAASLATPPRWVSVLRFALCPPAARRACLPAPRLSLAARSRPGSQPGASHTGALLRRGAPTAQGDAACTSATAYRRAAGQCSRSC